MKKMKLLLEQSRLRETVIRLNKLDEPTPEQREELNSAVDRLEAIEPEIRAATTAEAAEAAEVAARGGEPAEDAETRERNALARKARVGAYLRAALTGRRVADGVEAELAAAFGVGDGDIPQAVFDIPHRDRLRQAEARATTGAPTTVGVNMAPIAPFVFAPSLAPTLGVEIRDVPSGTYAIPRITTAPSTAAPKAKAAPADATAGAITVASTTPHRVPARLSLALEDIAAFGSDDFENALRQALQSKLSDSLDNQILNGNGTSPNLSGFFKQLTDPTTPASKVEDYARWLVIATSPVEGHWATRLSEIALIVNAETYRQAAGQFRGEQSPDSALSYMTRELAAFRSSSRMPATASNIASILCARLGQPGFTRAVVPNWGRLTVDDIYSDSDHGTRHITVSAIVGDLLLVQPAAYAELAARVSV